MKNCFVSFEIGFLWKLVQRPPLPLNQLQKYREKYTAAFGDCEIRVIARGLFVACKWNGNWGLRKDRELFDPNK